MGGVRACVARACKRGGAGARCLLRAAKGAKHSTHSGASYSRMRPSLVQCNILKCANWFTSTSRSQSGMGEGGSGEEAGGPIITTWCALMSATTLARRPSAASSAATASLLAHKLE